MKYNIMELDFSSPFNKLIKRSSVGKASLSNLDILYQPEICDLERGEIQCELNQWKRSEGLPDEGLCPPPSPAASWSH